jgi:hypothetical protein
MYFASTGVFSYAQGGIPIAGAILGDVKNRDIAPQDLAGMIIYIGFLMLVCTPAVWILDGRGKGWKLIA